MPTALILAAGRGNRLRPLTDSTPKTLLQVGKKTLLEHHLDRLATQGFTEVVINLAWLGKQIRDHLGDGKRFGLRVRYSEEPDGALETGGGVVNALGLLRSDPFIVINGDVFCDFDFGALRVGEGCDMHLVLVENPPHNPEGDFGLVEGVVLDGGELPTWTYAGIGCFRHRAFDGFGAERFPLVSVIRRGIAERRVSGEVYGGRWVDVGTKERLREVRGG